MGHECDGLDMPEAAYNPTHKEISYMIRIHKIP